MQALARAIVKNGFVSIRPESRLAPLTEDLREEMTSEEREYFRWTFAGQAMAAYMSRNNTLFWDHKMCVDHANDLITELERTATFEKVSTSWVDEVKSGLDQL